MRADMSKVLVEEPRHGRAYARVIAGTRRLARNRIDPDGEGGPVHLGMQGNCQRSKNFGEHLGPLYRYLRQQVNRPWAKVYGELCAALDRRSVVQAHLFQHIRDQVEYETVWHNDAVWVRSWRGMVPLAESRAEMFVHPRTGILLVNRARVIARRKNRQTRAEQAQAGDPDRRVGLPHMAADVQWHRVDGIWYELSLRPVTDLTAISACFDVLLKRIVTPHQHQLLRQHYGSATHYAHHKRQLDAKTLRRHGLADSRVI